MYRLLISCLLAVLILDSTVSAWTSHTYQIVVVQSTKLMPASFQRIMRQHKEEILRGSLKPDDKGEEFHRYDLSQRSGYLQNRVLELTQSIPEEIRTHRPFREVAEQFGRLSHYMSDLNDPLLLVDSDPRELQYSVDFQIYAEKNIPKFPWIFDGHENIYLKEGKVQDFIYDIASRASSKYDRLGEAFFPNGFLVSSDTFDERSLPFGIASLSYSHAITNTVQIWFYTWQQSHGDITYTPLYKGKKKIKGASN
jgi:hypothetical protein